MVDHDARRQIVADGVEDVTYIGFGGLDDGGSGDAVAVNDLSGTGVPPTHSRRQRRPPASMRFTDLE